MVRRRGQAHLELASLRAGGATDLYVATENWTLVQARGRWQSLRVMQVYIQELVATSFYAQLPARARHLVAYLARGSPAIIEVASRLLQAGATPQAWKAGMLEVVHVLDSGPRSVPSAADDDDVVADSRGLAERAGPRRR